MSDKITVEEMVEWMDVELKALQEHCEISPHNEVWTTPRDILQAIRKHLTESDLAHWMDRCHELEAKLAEKPVAVSREWIENKVDERHKQHDERGYFDPMLREIRIKDFIETLTELDIEVSDNSEVGRRTSDKEGE